MNFSEKSIKEEPERGAVINEQAVSPRIEAIKHQAKIVEFKRN
jgi:hypothetical protein